MGLSSGGVATRDQLHAIMGKNTAYKRRLRAAQKVKKKQKLKQSLALQPALQQAYDRQQFADDSTSESFGSPGSPPPTPEASPSPPDSVTYQTSTLAEETDPISHQVTYSGHQSADESSTDESFGSPGSPPPTPESSPSPPESVTYQTSAPQKLHKKLKQTTIHYQKQLKKQEEECKRKIKSIRSFWKDKIYNEGTRGGRILKLAMKSYPH